MDDWFALEDFPGYYVNTLGKIKGRRGLIGCPDKKGYVKISPRNRDGKQKTLNVNRLIAQTFIPNPDQLECVDHIDHNPSNNATENLRWLSKQDNIRYKKLVFKKNGMPRGVQLNYYKDGTEFYCAYVGCNGRQKYLGSFANVFDAELRRLNWEHENWGPHLMTFERRMRRGKMRWAKRCIAIQRRRRHTEMLKLIRPIVMSFSE